MSTTTQVTTNPGIQQSRQTFTKMFTKLKEKCNMSVNLYVVLTIAYFLLIVFLLIFVSFTLKKFIQLENGLNEILTDLDEVQEKYDKFEKRLEALGLTSILKSE